MKEFKLDTPYEFIQLNQLLKLLNLAESGGEANQCIAEGLVKVNGATEYQKRKKLRPGDTIEFENHSVLIS